MDAYDHRRGERDRLDLLHQLFRAEDELTSTRRADPEWEERSQRVRELAEEVFGPAPLVREPEGG